MKSAVLYVRYVCCHNKGGNLSHRLRLEKRLKEIISLHTGNMVKVMDQRFPRNKFVILNFELQICSEFIISGINTFIIKPQCFKEHRECVILAFTAHNILSSFTKDMKT